MQVASNPTMLTLLKNPATVKENNLIFLKKYCPRQGKIEVRPCLLWTLKEPF